MRSASTTKHDLEAVQLEQTNGHHLLEVVLDVIEEHVFVLNAVHV